MRIPFSIGRNAIVFLAILFAAFHPTDAYAQWTQIATFPRPIKCAFFFDELNGFIGFGGSTNPILRTTDGGATWSSVSVPSGGFSAVDDIWFRDHLDGWAALEIEQSDQYLWHTTDGGLTWTALNQSFAVKSVRETSHALSIADDAVDISLDGGAHFIPRMPTHYYGLGFVDDLHGVASPYQLPQLAYTSDGGQTWQVSATTFNPPFEAWGVTGFPGTPDFFAVGEDLANNGSRVIHSSDYGVNWTVLNTLPFRAVGDIQTSGGALFFQSQTTAIQPGLYRSIDRGANWAYIGGPANDFDHRFAVTSCGSVIYAFDNSGGVYKTTNGGDGLVLGAQFATTLSTGAITFAARRDCGPLDSISFEIWNPGCDTLTVESASLEGNISPALVSWADSTLPSRIVGYKLGVTVAIADLLAGSYNGSFRIRYHFADGVTHDTLIPVAALITKAVPQLAIDSNAMELGIVHACATRDTIIHFKNTGCIPVNIMGWNLSQWDRNFNVFGSGKYPPFPLAPGDSDSVHVTFNGLVPGIAYDTVIFFAGVAPDSTWRIPVSVTVPVVDSVSFRLTMQSAIASGEHVCGDILPDRNFRGKGLTSISGRLIFPTDNFDLEQATASSGLTITQQTPYTSGRNTIVPFNLTGSGDLSLDSTFPIAHFCLRATLTDTNDFRVTLDSVLLNGGDPTYARCTLATNGSVTQSTLALACADSLLIGKMGGKTLLLVAPARPNPVTGENDYSTSLHLQTAENGTAKVQIWDALGRLVSQDEIVIERGSHDYHLKLANAPSGRYSYVVRFISAHGESRARGSVVVMR
ncbi:MAG: hypothetical protein Q8922_07265 [Bacteroidota bacterium]|nr:hypothetical protein [Bacteroidota bacterium]MDP4244041.1 hypothetical protein [Bacteroidota bacterium]MDP4287720.1 hypothetical protein [Bacteroidota bacterium]